MEFDFDSTRSIESFFLNLQSEASPRNLSQIFEDDLLPMQKESRNLRYQPGGQKAQPAPTTSREVSTKSRSAAAERKSRRWEVIFAKVVNIYNGYESLERMGLALTMMGDNEAASMILYKQKNKLMSKTNLQPNGSTIHLQDHYVQFYDNNRKHWSLRFVHQADEQEFIHVMTTNGWALEQRTTTAETDMEQYTSSSETDVEQPTLKSEIAIEQQHVAGAESDVEQKQDTEPLSDQVRMQLSVESERAMQQNTELQSRQNLQQQQSDNEEHQELPPKPKPRSRNLAAPRGETMEEYLAYKKCLRHHFWHKSCEHVEIPDEDVIVTPMSKPIGSTSASCTSLAKPCSTATVAKLEGSKPESTTSLLAKFVDTHLSPEDVANMKIQSIWDAMQRVSDGHLQKFNDAPDKGTPKSEPVTTSKTEDAEDRLLEMEQCLLDAKKENRELLKELRRRNEELHNFQASSLTLLEKLLSTNDDLAKKNTLLVDTIMGERKATSDAVCVNCEHSAQQISFLKRHITALELALRESE